MNSDLKVKWLDALRSGKTYVQTKEKLYVGKDEQGRFKMCCLGVLEHICGTSIATFQSNTSRHGVELPNGLTERMSPEEVFQQKNIFPSANPIGSAMSDMEGHLAQMNDHGKSFEEIADFIDQNL